MFRTYLISIVIYAIVIWVASALFEKDIIANGWVDVDEFGQHAVSPVLVLIAIAATPIYRVIYIAILYYMAMHTRDEWEGRQ